MGKHLLIGLLVLSQTYTFSQKLLPEFSSFGRLDISEYIDPSTGDFVFKPILLTIPNTGRDFPIILNYSAGIGLNEDASWVGLGFDLEMGSIYRNVSAVPDDYNGAKIKLNQYDPGGQETIDVPTKLEQIAAAMKNLKNQLALATQQLNRLKYGDKRGVYLGVGALLSASRISLDLMTNYNFIRYPLTFPKIIYGDFSSWDYKVDVREDKDKFLWVITTDIDVTISWSLNKEIFQNNYGLLYESNKPVYSVSPNDNRYFNPSFTDGTSQILKCFNRPDIIDVNKSYDSANVSSDYYQRSKFI